MNNRNLAASLYHHIYPRSNFYNMKTDGQREWISGVDALISKIRESYSLVRKPKKLSQVKSDYNIYINSSYIGSVENESQAWDAIGERPFGSCHLVTDRTGDTRREFVPF